MGCDNRKTSDQLDNDINSGVDIASRTIPKINSATQRKNGSLPSRPTGSRQSDSPISQAGASSDKKQSADNKGQSSPPENKSGEHGANGRGGAPDRPPSSFGQRGGFANNNSGAMPNPSSNSLPANHNSRSSLNDKMPVSKAASDSAKAIDSAFGNSGNSNTAQSESLARGGQHSANNGSSIKGGQPAGSGNTAGSSGTVGATGSAAGAGATTGAASSTGGSVGAGAVTGSAAGPVGAAAGAAAGTVVPELIKLIIKVLIAIAFMICVFCMHPSTLYDFPQAVIDRKALESTYNAYYESVEDEYRKDIQSAKIKARSSSSSYNAEMKNDYTTACDGRITLSDVDLSEVEGILNDNGIDRIKYSAPVTEFSIEDHVLLESMCGNINLVISLLDVKKNHWFIQLTKWILNSATGGWVSKFTEGASRWWDGLWNDFVIHQLSNVAAEVWTEEIMDDDDPDRVKEVIGYIKYTFTYDLRDLGVGFYSDKLGLTIDEVNRAAEMSHYLGDLFGNISEFYSGWYVTPGDWSDPLSGGSTGQRIEDEIAKLVNEPEISTSSQVFPLYGYTNPIPSSWFGPRDFALDPFHTGIDFKATLGTPIVAVQDGVILYTEYHFGGFGRHIVVYHGNNVSTIYAHMSKLGQYKTGDAVKAGDVIGYVGSTGLSTGPHLHFQLNIGKQAHNPIHYFTVFEYLR